MTPSILVTGATGTTGSALVRRLDARGTPVRIFVRDAGRAAGLSAPTAQVAVGDLTDGDSLARALEGIETVFLLTPVSPDQEAVQGKVVDAARAAGVRHLVKLSALGTSPDSPAKLGRWHASVEERIRGSGMGYTFLHPHSFMQNLLASAPLIREQGVFYGASGDGAFSAVDARDIAAVAAAILQDPAPHHGKTYTVTGPEAVSHPEMAAHLSDALGRPVRYVNLPPEAFRAGMVGAGLPDWLAEDLASLQVFFSTGHGAAVSPAVRDLAGEPGIPFAAFARDHAAAFA